MWQCTAIVDAMGHVVKNEKEGVGEIWRFDILERILTAGWLLIASVIDIRSKRVPVWLLALGGLGTVAVMMYGGTTEHFRWSEIILGCIPGALILLTAAITGKAGAADGIVLLFLGQCIGGRACLVIFMASLFLISVCSGILLMLRRARKNTALPYLPFLFVAWLLGQGVQIGG